MLPPALTGIFGGPPTGFWQKQESEFILGNKDRDLEEVLPQWALLGKFTHFDLHFQRCQPHYWLDEHQLPSLLVGALDHQHPQAIALQDGKAKAVSYKAAGGHLEEDPGHGAVGLESQVVERDGIGSLPARTAFHGTRASLTVAERRQKGNSSRLAQFDKQAVAVSVWLQGNPALAWQDLALPDKACGGQRLTQQEVYNMQYELPDLCI